MLRLKKAGLSVLISAALGFFASASVFAHPVGQTCQEDISYLFCDALKNDQIYDEYRYSSYKTLINGKVGWIFRTGSDLKTDFTLPKTTLLQLQKLSRAFEAKGSKLVILYIPTRGMVHYENIFPKDRERYGYSHPDKVWKNYWSAVQSMKDKGINVVGITRPEQGESFYYQRDHHWNADGAKRSAQELAAYIQKFPEYKNMKKTSFSTRDGDRYAFYGVSKKVFKKLCNTIQPPEIIVKKITVREKSASDTSELFGETKNPDIVLMGTSNSTQEPAYANFEGFLKQSLSVDILNMSVSGGGLDTAVLSYLHSDYFKKAPSSIAIWEVPSYYDISAQTNFFREAVPAAYGDCGSAAIASKNLPSNGSSIVLFDDLAPKKIRGEDYYIHFKLSEPVSEPVVLHMAYGAGRMDRYKFRRSERQRLGSEFYLSLTPEKKGTLTKVSLSLPSQVAGASIEAKICRVSALSIN